MAFLGIGPTELRVLLAMGALALINTPVVAPFGIAPVRLWDLGGVIGAAGMTGAFVAASWNNGKALYLLETRR
jgi:hypothetical protein